MTKIDNCPICGELWTRFRAASGEMSYSCNSCFFIITERLAYYVDQALEKAFDRVRIEARRKALEDTCRALCQWCNEGIPVERCFDTEYCHEAGYCTASAIHTLIEQDK